jgi:hypothetical protein
MPLGFHPEGMPDNSPTFQRWGWPPHSALKSRRDGRPLACPFIRPFGLNRLGLRSPNVETLGYCRMSLRDKDSPLAGMIPCAQNPSGIARPRQPSPAAAICELPGSFDIPCGLRIEDSPFPPVLRLGSPSESRRRSIRPRQRCRLTSAATKLPKFPVGPGVANHQETLKNIEKR